MLTGLIFILRMTICQVTKLFHRNEDLYLLFSSRLSLIVCCCFFCFSLKLFLVGFLNVFGSLAMPNFIVGVITNLQSLNHEHMGKPTVCLLSG